MADPVTLANAARYVYLAWSSFTGGGLNRAQRRALDASGAVTGPRGLSIDGRRVSQAEAIAAGRAVLARPVPLPTPPLVPTPPVYQTPEGLLREVFGRRPTFVPGGGNLPSPPSLFEELLQRRPTFTPSGGTVADALPRAAARGAIAAAARAAGLLGGLLWPTATADSDLGYKRPPSSGGRPPPKGPSKRFRRLPKDPTRWLRRFPYDWRPSPTPQLPDTPRIRPESSLEPEPLSRPIGQPGARPANPPKIAPQPSRPALPQVAPTPTATPATSIRVSPLAFLAPLLSPFSSPTPIPRPGRPPVTLSPLQPGRPIGATDQLRQIDRRPLTAPLPQPLASPIGGGSDPCKCTRSSRPKKKRKPRSVCYRGSFTETRSSTLKIRKERIPCQ